jgi:hypothetical protein
MPFVIRFAPFSRLFFSLLWSPVRFPRSHSGPMFSAYSLDIARIVRPVDGIHLLTMILTPFPPDRTYFLRIVPPPFGFGHLGILSSHRLFIQIDFRAGFQIVADALSFDI